MTPILANTSEDFFAAVYLFLALLPLMLILVYLFYRKSLQHRQIMKAIETGVPVSELLAKPDPTINWVRNLSLGIGLLLIGAVLTCYAVVVEAEEALVVMPIIICGIGVIFLLRGILQRNVVKNKDK